MQQHPASSWYVQVMGQVYGPYDLSTMQAFIQEGRIVEDSMISPNPSGGFDAARNSIFFRASAPEPYAAPMNAAPLQPQPTVQVRQKPIVFVIMAEINSENAMKFLHAMQKLGTAQRIGDTVWLLKSAMSIDELQNHLSAPLSRQDRLFILDSFNNKPAWHNIGADMDQRIRELWANT